MCFIRACGDSAEDQSVLQTDIIPPPDLPKTTLPGDREGAPSERRHPADQMKELDLNPEFKMKLLFIWSGSCRVSVYMGGKGNREAIEELNIDKDEKIIMRQLQSGKINKWVLDVHKHSDSPPKPQKPPQTERYLKVWFPVVYSNNTQGAKLSSILWVNYTDTQTGSGSQSSAWKVSTTVVHAVYVPLLRKCSRRF